MSTLPVKADLLIVQRAEFVAGWRLLRDGAPLDLTGYTVESQARTAEGDLILDVAQYVTVNAGAVTGRVLIDIPATVTEDLTLRGKWDLFLTPPGNPGGRFCFLEGAVKVNKAETQ